MNYLFLILLMMFSFVQGNEKVLVKHVEGEVEYQKPKTEKWKKVKINGKLKEKDALRTGSSSRVDLLFKDGSKVKIGENAKATIKEIKEKKDVSIRNLSLEKGDLLFQIEKLSKGSKFDFEAHTATASVRGTECEFGTNRKRAFLACREGSAKLISKISNDSVDVCTGCIAIQELNGMIVIRYVENQDEFEKMIQKSKQILFGEEGDSFSADSLLTSLLAETPTFLETVLDPDSSRKYLSKIERNTWVPLEGEKQTYFKGQFWNFKNWELSGDSAEVEKINAPSTKIQLLGQKTQARAVYEKAYFSTKLEFVNGRIEGVVDTLILGKGESRLLKPIPNTGYLFDRWIYDEREIKIEKDVEGTYLIQSLADSTKLKAIFSKKVSKIYIKTQFPNAIHPSGETSLAVGEEMDLEANDPPGYFFKEWKIEGGKATLSSKTEAKIKVTLLDSNTVIVPVFLPIPKITIDEYIGDALTQTTTFSAAPYTNVNLRNKLKTSGKDLIVREKKIDFGEGVIEGWEIPILENDLKVSIYFESPIKKAELQFFNEAGESKTLYLEYR